MRVNARSEPEIVVALDDDEPWATAVADALTRIGLSATVETGLRRHHIAHIRSAPLVVFGLMPDVHLLQELQKEKVPRLGVFPPLGDATQRAAVHPHHFDELVRTKDPDVVARSALALIRRKRLIAAELAELARAPHIAADHSAATIWVCLYAGARATAALVRSLAAQGLSCTAPEEMFAHPKPAFGAAMTVKRLEESGERPTLVILDSLQAYDSFATKVWQRGGQILVAADGMHHGSHGRDTDDFVASSDPQVIAQAARRMLDARAAEELRRSGSPQLCWPDVTAEVRARGRNPEALYQRMREHTPNPPTEPWRCSVRSLGEAFYVELVLEDTRPERRCGRYFPVGQDFIATWRMDAFAVLVREQRPTAADAEDLYAQLLAVRAGTPVTTRGQLAGLLDPTRWHRGAPPELAGHWHAPIVDASRIAFCATWDFDETFGTIAIDLERRTVTPTRSCDAPMPIRMD